MKSFANRLLDEVALIEGVSPGGSTDASELMREAAEEIAGLENKFADVEAHRTRLMAIVYHHERRLEAFQQYIQDFETGMRVVERCARGTIGCKTTIPSLKKEDAVEAIVSAIVSLYRILDDAKQRVNQISDVELEMARKANEAARRNAMQWAAERKAKLEQTCDESK